MMKSIFLARLKKLEALKELLNEFKDCILDNGKEDNRTLEMFQEVVSGYETLHQFRYDSLYSIVPTIIDQLFKEYAILIILFVG